MHPVILNLFERLPRQGPGDAASTRRALATFGVLREDALIVDLGCGTGASTFELLQATRARVAAVDRHLPFLDRLRDHALRRGLEQRLVCIRADMARPPFDDHSVDLIWAEGAIGHVGFEEGLRRWRRLLKPGAGVAVSHLTWLQPPRERAPEAVAWWNEAAPGMCAASENAEIARRAGYEVVEAFLLPVSAWWEHYYLPLAVRIDMARIEIGDDHPASAPLAALAHEIALFRAHGDTYGYVFYLLRSS